MVWSVNDFINLIFSGPMFLKLNTNMDLPINATQFKQYLEERLIEPSTLYRKKYESVSSGKRWTAQSIKFIKSGTADFNQLVQGSTMLKVVTFPSPTKADLMNHSDPKLKGAVVLKLMSEDGGNDIYLFKMRDRLAATPSLSNTEVEIALKPLGISRAGHAYRDWETDRKSVV